MRVGLGEVECVDLRPVVVGQIGACAGADLDDAAVRLTGGEAAVWRHAGTAYRLDEAVVNGGEPAMSDRGWVDRHGPLGL